MRRKRLEAWVASIYRKVQDQESSPLQERIEELEAHLEWLVTKEQVEVKVVAMGLEYTEHPQRYGEPVKHKDGYIVKYSIGGHYSLYLKGTHHEVKESPFKTRIAAWAYLCHLEECRRIKEEEAGT